jgi:predicted alpha/beta hydrolase
MISNHLWNSGFNVLIMDLRNHGKSSKYGFQGSYITFGSEEYKDVYGAINFLKAKYNTTIGILGYGMGKNFLIY